MRSRRSQRRSGTANSGPWASGIVHALSGWDTTNVLATAASAGLTCPDTGGNWGRCLHWVVSQSVSATRRIFTCTDNGEAAGCGISTLTTNATLAVIGRFAAGAVTAPTLTITAAMVGKLLDTVWVWDKAAGRLRMYHQGVEVGSGTSTASTMNANTTLGTRWGTRNTTPSLPADENAICASEGGDGFTPTSAEIYAAHVATRNRVRASMPPLAGIAGKTTWRAQVGAAWDPPTSITAEVGGNMTMVAGAASGLALATLNAPQWA